MKKVAHWQIEDIKKNGWRWSSTDWTNGAYYTGQMAWSQIANDPEQLDFLKGVGEKNNWEGGPHERFFADDYCVGQTYAQLFMLYKDSAMIKPMIKLCDDVLAQPHTESLLWNFEGGLHNREWAWCDALFMGPPTLAYIYKVTGNKKYLDGMNELWWRSSDYLYDSREHLYFRDSRFFNKKEKNGTKVFWSRGNGWVIAGLTRILDNMPADYPARPRYLKIFKDMAERIVNLQQPDGTWHASLLDPKSYPVKETSGTGFFTYSLAWGVNRGYLSYEKYFPVIKKAWTALNGCVHPDGKLGFVQVPGAAPEKVGYDDSETYGVGAYLLAGTELFKMMFEKDAAAKKAVVHNNTLPLDRSEEIVEMQWTQFAESKFDPASTIVVNAQTNEEIPSQIIYSGGKTPKAIIFQSGITAGSSGYFYFKKQKPKIYTSKTFGRFVPERYDDFAWENDKIAYRMYGAALDSRPDNAKGIDVWLKRTSSMVINKWYKRNDYHIDHGEGVDAYKVGFTLGAGNSAPLTAKGLDFSKNYSDYKILDQGPLRFTFELIYKPWEADGREVQQVKTISVDAGSNLNKVTDDYQFDGETLTIATGVTKHNDDGSPVIDPVNRFVSYWDQADGKVDNGKVGVGVIIPGYERVSFKNELGHLLAIATLKKNQPFVYYQGAGWNRSGFFPNEQAWIDYLADYSRKLKHPLEVIW